MGKIRLILVAFCVGLSIKGFSQNQPETITSEWDIISQGKLQKNPRFKDPMISVRFIYENGTQYMNLSLKYMFTDAVFDEAVPVEYIKNERLEVETDKGKHELRAAQYAKARRVNAAAQKIADMRVLFVGNLSFLGSQSIKKFIVHFAQGYQNIDVNQQEANALKNSYNNFLTMIPATTPPPPLIRGKVEETEHAIPQKKESIDDLRERAKKWNR